MDSSALADDAMLSFFGIRIYASGNPVLPPWESGLQLLINMNLWELPTPCPSNSGSRGAGNV